MTYIDKISAMKTPRPLSYPAAWLVGAGLSVLSVFLFCALFLRIMNFEMRKDEQLYVPPVSLLDGHDIYSDFFYNHLPGSAWLFHGIGKLAGTDHLLLSGRIGVFLAWLFFAGAIAGISYALTRSALASWCITLLGLANQLFILQTGMAATNNFLPLPFSFLGLGLFLLAVRNSDVRSFQVALAGVSLSLAVCFKANAISFIPPVAIAAFLLPRSLDLKQRLVRVVAPLAAGGLAGAIPVLVHLLSNPGLFLAHVIGYHTGPHLAYWKTPGADGEDAVLSLGEKLLLAHDIWLSAGVAIGLCVLLAMLLTRLHAPQDDSWREHDFSTALSMVLFGALVCSIALSFVPTPSFPQYFAPPLICLPLGLALVFSALGHKARQYMQVTLVAAAVVVLAVIAPYLAQFLGRAANPDRWTVMQVHDAGVTIAQRMAQAGVEGKVATLSPVYPLEGGLDVYLEFATGPFAYRTADITAPELAAFYRMTSPTKVEALFDRDPPAALLLGFDEALERPMLAYAQRHGYRPAPDLGIKDRYGVPILYLKPLPARTPAAF